MEPKFEIAPSAPEQEPVKIEVIQRELLEAKKYSEYLLNSLNAASKDVKQSPEFLQVMKKAKELSEEIYEYLILNREDV